MVLERVGAHGLTPQQFWALVNIDEADGPSLGGIAERLRMDAPTASRAVAQLQQRRLVTAEGDRQDRRRLRLRLTPAGQARIGPLRAIAGELRGASIHGLTRGVRKMIANLDRLAGGA